MKFMNSSCGQAKSIGVGTTLLIWLVTHLLAHLGTTKHALILIRGEVIFSRMTNLNFFIVYNLFLYDIVFE